jgi:hypothetical protein
MKKRNAELARKRNAELAEHAEKTWFFRELCVLCVPDQKRRQDFGFRIA